jgi:hypothetical protein
MASTRQYWNALKSTRNAIALDMGVQESLTPKDMRASDNAGLAAVAIVIKALTDKGVLTDAELQAAQAAALADIWDEEHPLP